MVSTFTPNGHLELQGTGDNSGTWGSVLNNNVITVIDTIFGGVQTLSLASTDVTVSTTQSQNNAVLLTGVLTADVAVFFPSIGRTYYIANNTTGAHSVTIKTASAGVTVVIPQGASGFHVLTGANVLVPTQPGISIGTVQTFAMTTPPAGWLECDGSAISRSTYAALFNTIGTTFGTGDGTTTFNIPDMRGYFARGWDHGRGIDPARVFGSTQASANLAHVHAFVGDSMPPHAHGVAIGSGDSPDQLPAGGTAQIGTFSTTSVSAGTPTGTIGSTGGSEARPVNVALMYAIRAV